MNKIVTDMISTDESNGRLAMTGEGLCLSFPKREQTSCPIMHKKSKRIIEVLIFSEQQCFH